MPNQDSWKSGGMIMSSSSSFLRAFSASSSSMVKSQYGRVSFGLTSWSSNENKHKREKKKDARQNLIPNLWR